MGGLIALDGRDVVAAFVTGGFRVARRERGLALLVRGVQVVVVPENVPLSETRIQGLLERAEVSVAEMLAWLATSGAGTRAGSGFHRRTPSEPPPTIHDAVKGASDARARADAAHIDARNALASTDAFQQALEKWREAVRELDESAKPAAGPRKR